MKIDELCFDLHAQRALKASMGSVKVCKGQMLISAVSLLCPRSTRYRRECKKGRIFIT
jgi:hypothetical protein